MSENARKETMKEGLEITAEYLRSILSYDPGAGVFRGRVSRSGPAHVGDVAGYLGDRGYWLVTIDGRRYYASRLAWLYQTGAWPVAEIDHKNLGKEGDLWMAQININGKRKYLGRFATKGKAMWPIQKPRGMPSANL
jgi:hypothetical protein